MTIAMTIYRTALTKTIATRFAAAARRRQVRRGFVWCIAIGLPVLVLGATGGVSAADLVIDPSASFLTGSGYVDNFDPPNQNVQEPITAQVVGSLTTSLNGSLSVTIGPSGDLNLSTVQIAVGNTPGLFTPGNVPANFAGQIVNPEFGGSSIGYLAGMLLSFAGSDIPLSADGTFSANLLSEQVTAGALNWATPSIGFLGSQSLVSPLGNVTSGLGEFLTPGPGVEQLTIPIDVTLTVPAAGQLVHYEFTGQIVATVPEPGAFFLAVVGAACAIATLVRRRQRAVYRSK
jgi:hypothetical protein